MNGESFRLATSKRAQPRQGQGLNPIMKKATEGATAIET
jgi:hypothetical protein